MKCLKPNLASSELKRNSNSFVLMCNVFITSYMVHIHTKFQFLPHSHQCGPVDCVYSCDDTLPYVCHITQHRQNKPYPRCNLTRNRTVWDLAILRVIINSASYPQNARFVHRFGNAWFNQTNVEMGLVKHQQRQLKQRKWKNSALLAAWL